jgi:hypothetical protein
MKQDYQICFPTIPAHFTDIKFDEIVTKMNIGKIEKSVVTRHKKKGILSGFVKFSDWDNHTYDNKIKQKLIQDKYVYIIYDFPEYLKCSLFK